MFTQSNEESSLPALFRPQFLCLLDSLLFYPSLLSFMETTGLESQAVSVAGQKVTMALQRSSRHKWDEVNNKQTQYWSRFFCGIYALSVLK